MGCIVLIFRQFIAAYWLVFSPGARQDSQCLRPVCTLRSPAEILLGAQCRNLLCHGHINELIQRDSFAFRNLPQFFHQ